MCLIAIGFRASARYPLIVAANRDESHARPSAAAAWWPDRPPILAGRDLEAGGTWLGVDRGGRLAAVTNLRDASGAAAARATPAPAASAPPDRAKGQKRAPRSRGLLVASFLADTRGVDGSLAALEAEAHLYRPFNLLLYDGAELGYASNRAPSRSLGYGVHAFSNTLPGDPWPKIARARDGVLQVLEEPEPMEALFALLAEGAREPRVSDADMRRSALFQLDAAWGTRCSTVVLVDAGGRVRFRERRFDAAGRPAGESGYEFGIEPRR
ncbi:MAG TPA: NRDE family protein [Gammaproteobacteria bacterium]|nr:NRDE family protein [Gammaproteobacteria bacterium]